MDSKFDERKETRRMSVQEPLQQELHAHMKCRGGVVKGNKSLTQRKSENENHKTPGGGKNKERPNFIGPHLTQREKPWKNNAGEREKLLQRRG